MAKDEAVVVRLQAVLDGCGARQGEWVGRYRVDGVALVEASLEAGSPAAAVLVRDTRSNGCWSVRGQAWERAKKDGGIGLTPPWSFKSVAAADAGPAPAVGSRWRHYKGGRYEVTFVGLDAETLVPVVAYHSADRGHRWLRTLADWSAELELNGGPVGLYRVRRFRPDPGPEAPAREPAATSVPTPEAARPFADGDPIVATKGSFQGQRLAYSHRGHGPIHWARTLGSGTRSVLLHAGEFEHAPAAEDTIEVESPEAPTPLATGDPVRITAGYYAGRPGTILEPHVDEGLWVVRADGPHGPSGSSLTVLSDRELEFREPRPFAHGDRIRSRLTGRLSWFEGYREGDPLAGYARLIRPDSSVGEKFAMAVADYEPSPESPPAPIDPHSSATPARPVDPPLVPYEPEPGTRYLDQSGEVVTVTCVANPRGGKGPGGFISRLVVYVHPNGKHKYVPIGEWNGLVNLAGVAARRFQPVP